MGFPFYTRETVSCMMENYLKTACRLEKQGLTADAIDFLFLALECEEILA